MYLKQVQELKRLHLKAKGTINHQQYEVSILSSIQHAMQVLGTLHESDAPRLACAMSDERELRSN